MAPPTQAKARLAQAKTCFANAQDADLKARCDVSTECLVELRSIRALLELASDKSGDERLRYTKDAESKASAMVKRAVEALAIDDALRVLKLFPEDEVIKGAVEKVEAVRDARSRRRRSRACPSRVSALHHDPAASWGIGRTV